MHGAVNEKIYPWNSKMYQFGRCSPSCVGVLPSVPSRLPSAPQRKAGSQADEDGYSEHQERTEQVRLDRHQKDDSQADSGQQQGR